MVTSEKAAVFFEIIRAKKARLSGRTISAFMPGSGSIVAKKRLGVNHIVAASKINTNPIFIKGKNLSAFSIRFILTHI